MRTVFLGLAGALAVGSFMVRDAVAKNGGVPSVKPADLGVVAAPSAGSTVIELSDVPALVLHSARVAFKEFDGNAIITAAQVDADEIKGIYEIKGSASDGTLLEADIGADAVLEELEIGISAESVPASVSDALLQFAPEFEAADESPSIEKSIRPTSSGLPEIWYEFSGVDFDVEIRSDARGILIEPA